MQVCPRDRRHRRGKNAQTFSADAAVATSAALNVTEPSCCGIGRDAFCLFYDAKTKKVKALNGSGRSPEKLSIDYLRQRGITSKKIPVTDINAVTVPGEFRSSTNYRIIAHFHRCRRRMGRHSRATGQREAVSR